MSLSTQIDSLQPVTLSGCLTETDVRHAHRLAAKSWKYRVWLSIAVMVVFVLVFVAVAVSSRPYSPEASNRILFAVCVFYPAILFVPWIRSRVKLRKLLRTKPDAFHPYETTMDSEGVKMKDGTSESKFAWEAFTRFRASESMCLLYWKDSPHYCMIRQSRFPDSESWEAFLGFVQSRFTPV